MTTSNANHREQTTVEESGGNYTESHVDAVFDVLSDARRRRTIRALRERGDRTPVTELADALAGREPGSPETEQLVVSLQHVHLPKLEATGVVECVDDGTAVRYDDAPLVETLLDQV
ncbi:DUF7344 domain-containing protein [Haloplanus sp. C73]|uniref:DUF7344 domain-containing protein n=1 Tax=Haloplanus sp. C73 TaxID=3421641 RepID=UPI003EB9DCF4